MAHKLRKHKGRDAISRKIAILVREGKDPKQAAAIAYSMKRAGRLGQHGEYRRVGRRRA